MPEPDSDSSTKSATTIFEPYDYVGMVVPGAVLLLGFMYFGEKFEFLGKPEEFGLGALGLFLVAAFSIGHVLLAIGEAGEYVWWHVAGRPTDWVLKEDHSCVRHLRRKPEIISPGQRRRLVQLVERDFDEKDFDRLSTNDWKSLTRELYATVKKAGGTDRVDRFNRTRAFYSGLAVALFAIAILVWISHKPWWLIAVMSFVTLIAVLRMRYFSILYGRELLVSYLVFCVSK
jgi:hypothetical protein